MIVVKTVTMTTLKRRIETLMKKIIGLRRSSYVMQRKSGSELMIC